MTFFNKQLMKNLIKTTILLFVVITAASFKNNTSPNFIGVYGVSANDPAQIKLTLNENRTFAYQDFSNPDRKICIKGNWILQKNTVVLKSNDLQGRFHNRWRFSDDGKLAKSRKGMTFYALGKLD